jgi:hypothetical protein
VNVAGRYLKNSPSIARLKVVEAQSRKKKTILIKNLITTMNKYYVCEIPKMYACSDRIHP